MLGAKERGLFVVCATDLFNVMVCYDDDDDDDKQMTNVV